MRPGAGAKPQLAIVAENAPPNHLAFTGEGGPAGVRAFDRAVPRGVLPAGQHRHPAHAQLAAIGLDQRHARVLFPPSAAADRPHDGL